MRVGGHENYCSYPSDPCMCGRIEKDHAEYLLRNEPKVKRKICELEEHAQWADERMRELETAVLAMLGELPTSGADLGSAIFDKANELRVILRRPQL